MDWLRQDFPYAKVSGPEEFFYEVNTERNGDVIRTEIRIKNQGVKPYFTNDRDIRISFPVPDQYEDSTTCLTKRCHTHIFCGREISWVCALRMGGEAPHLGMVVTAMTEDAFISIRKAWNLCLGKSKKSAGLFLRMRGRKTFSEKQGSIMKSL